jgi:hypothetical protein
MPKKVDDLVKKLLADPDFYPEKSEKEQEAIAWAIAYSKNKSKKKSKKSSTDLFKLVQASKLLESYGAYNASDLVSNELINYFNDNSNNTK